MRCIIFLGIVFLTACGDGSSESAATFPSPAASPSGAVTYLRASKLYGPPVSYTDDTFDGFGPMVIPATASILAGNPGNGYALLTLSYGRSTQITCRYQGNGDTYVFDLCTNGALAGDTFFNEGTILWQIDDGNPSYGTTTARIAIRWSNL